MYFATTLNMNRLGRDRENMAKCRGGKPAEHNTAKLIWQTRPTVTLGFLPVVSRTKKWVDSAPGGITVAT